MFALGREELKSWLSQQEGYSVDVIRNPGLVCTKGV